MPFFDGRRDSGLWPGYAAPFDVVFDQFNVVEPDLLFIATERLGAVLTAANVQGAPDLAVEVLSPGTRTRDLGIKLQLYARFGVRFYCVVEPDRETVQPYELSEGAYRELPLLTRDDALTCPLFPGLSASVPSIFI